MDRISGYSEQMYLGDKIFSVHTWERSFMDLRKNTISVSTSLLHECWWDIRCASSRIYTMNKVGRMAKDKSQVWMLALSEILSKPKVYKEFVKTLQHHTDPTHNNAFVQMFFLSQLAGTEWLHPRISETLNNPIDSEKIEQPHIREIREKLISENWITSVQQGLGLILQELRKYPLQDKSLDRSLPLHLLSELARSQWLLDVCREISSTNKTIKKKVEKQIEKKDKDKKKKEFQETPAQSFQQEYSPKDSIMESSPDSPVQIIGTRSPPIWWYFKEKVWTWFTSSLQWETSIDKKKIIMPSTWDITHTYECILPNDDSMVSLPLPHGLIPAQWDDTCKVAQAKHWLFLISWTPWLRIRIWCRSSDKENWHLVHGLDSDLSDYSQPLCSILPKDVQNILDANTWSKADQLTQFASAIRSKLYSTKYQWTYKNNSSTADEYIALLREANKMECYSANHLMIALARHIWVPARLAMWYRTNFTHNSKTAISSNDGHARAELYINGKWQRRDVTPLTPDPEDDNDENADTSPSENSEDNPSQSQDPSDTPQDLSEQDPLEELEDMAEHPITEEDIAKILESKTEDPDISAQRREWISLEQAKDTYDRLQKNKHRSSIFARKLKNWLQDVAISHSSSQANTKRPTWDLDIQRVLKNQKLLTQHPDEVIKLANSELPIWRKKTEQIKEIVSLPEELRLHMYIDVSGSMGWHRESVKNDIVMIWDSLRQLAWLTKKLWMKVSVEIHAFADRGTLFSWDGESTININMTDKSISHLSNLLTKIPNKFQRSAGTWNDENSFYEDVVLTRYEEKNKEEKSKKRIKHIWLSFTDQETLTDWSSSFGKKSIAWVSLPEQNNRDRLESYLQLLQSLDLPIIAVNCEGEAKWDSWYYSYIAWWSNHFNNMPQVLFDEITKLIPTRKK